MNPRALIAKLSQVPALNFAFTNLLPRRMATRFAGWFSRIEQPLVRELSIRIWRLFCDIDLSEARQQNFASLRHCFIRELKDGARPIDPDPELLVSPCDALVGMCGPIHGAELLQVKGSAYPLAELLRDLELAAFYRGGCYAALRLTAGMYHHFHAPHDCRVESVTHIPGDTWNVNPIALERVPKLYCRNERVIIRARLAATEQLVTLVPVAAILVAGIRLRFADLVVDPRNDAAPIQLPAECHFLKGQPMGWFEHGSTILVLAPPGFTLTPAVSPGASIRMGQPLMRLAKV